MNEVFEMSELCWVQDENGMHLEHHGIKGQKWGERRFQNEDGSLTEEGKRRYYDSLTDKQKKQYDQLAPVFQRGIERRMDKGKSFTKALAETNKASQVKALGLCFLGLPLVSSALGGAIGLGSYKAYQGLKTLVRKAVNSNAAEKVRQRASQFMKRYAAKKAGAITLGKNSYSIVNADPVRSMFGLIKR